MNVNISNVNKARRTSQQQMTAALQKIGQQQTTVDTLTSQKRFGSGAKDVFIRSGNIVNDAGVYSPSSIKKNAFIPDSLLFHLNHDNFIVMGVRDGIYEYKGYYFTADQIPKVDPSGLPEIKASDNIMDFGKSNYFKYVSKDGKEHALITDDRGIGTLYSEHLRGMEPDAIGEKYTGFWRYMMSRDPVYIGLSFSSDEVREYLREAGIKEGFFTVKMGDSEATQYYSASRTAGTIHSKERYDSKYEHLTSTGFELLDYKPGSVFKLNGKEYILSEEHTLDIPYGEDLWCLEYPFQNYMGRGKTDQLPDV